MSSWLEQPGAALRLEDADHPEGDPADRDVGADRVGPEPEVGGGRVAEDGNPQSRGRSTARSGTSPARSCRCGPSRSRAASRRSSWWCSGRRRRRASGSTARGRRRRPRGSRPTARCVVDRQGRCRAGRSARAEAGGAARVDREQVRAQALELRGDPARGALADGDEGHDRAHPDDHPEHRQDRPKPCRAQPGQGQPDQVERAHATSRPSRTWICRSALVATSASWVIRTTVRPVEWSSRRIPMTSAPLVVSRLPVGSSARIRAGSVTRARAIATRCCWPPDSSVGSWSSRSPRPRRSSGGDRPGVALLAADALVGERHRDVVERARPRQQVVALEDEPDRPAPDPGEVVVVELLDRRPVEDVAAGGRPVEAADDVHQGRLARARRPDDRHELAVVDDQVDAVEGPDVDPAGLVDPADPGEGDERRAHGWVTVPPPPLPRLRAAAVDVALERRRRGRDRRRRRSSWRSGRRPSRSRPPRRPGAPS